MILFITGGSRGIGKAVVLRAIESGWDVAFTYHNNQAQAQNTVTQANKLAPNRLCRAYKLDVRDAQKVEEVLDQVDHDIGNIDAVVCNAGININNLALSMTDEQWQQVIDTNLTGAFYTIRQALSYFLSNKKGRFILVSSIAKDGMSGQVNYSASKAGLVGLSAAIAKEYGSKGITSNVVVPGFFTTDMTTKTMSNALKKFWVEFCPLKRMGKLDELADVILFLSSTTKSTNPSDNASLAVIFLAVKISAFNF